MKNKAQLIICNIINGLFVLMDLGLAVLFFLVAFSLEDGGYEEVPSFVCLGIFQVAALVITVIAMVQQTRGVSKIFRKWVLFRVTLLVDGVGIALMLMPGAAMVVSVVFGLPFAVLTILSLTKLQDFLTGLGGKPVQQASDTPDVAKPKAKDTTVYVGHEDEDILVNPIEGVKPIREHTLCCIGKHFKDIAVQVDASVDQDYVDLCKKAFMDINYEEIEQINAKILEIYRYQLERNGISERQIMSSLDLAGMVIYPPKDATVPCYVLYGACDFALRDDGIAIFIMDRKVLRVGRRDEIMNPWLM